ncbi:copper chaperone PCu(A)C [Magnetospira sp. QH-2]|uniref:copper chaperone PCu(A)C n=1 Tax=Magnetospira sp. (strain QH-2) TaxID=1288970 RepID=UPI0003E81B7D|nr:copper chaperone PCu(A)C [Magnetospira sp. QH-2]CCQ75741.1 conserved protein of unknown function [Magnetospira sp. QH-2]
MISLRKTVLAAAAAMLLSTPAALADSHGKMTTVGDLTIKHVWARASAGMARAGAAFMQIENKGAEDKLVSASADVSKVVELHTHLMSDGVMRMRQVPNVPVPAGGKAELKPGSYHVMFMGLKEPLKEGQKFPVTLTFEKAGSTTVQVTVKSAGSMGKDAMKGHKMPMKGHDMGGHK